MNKLPFVSIVIPCRNEFNFIEACLDSVIQNDYPLENVEIFIVDGMSEDGTRVILEEYKRKYKFIKVLDNPKKFQSSAVNIGISQAKGEYVMRMDAHNVYPTNYISGLIRWIKKSGADNVGGVWKTEPAVDSPKCNAIAIALSHPFGIGNAYFRIGSSRPRWVDTVPFGCYKKQVFSDLGMFDEELMRAEDYEFNMRLIKNGGRILLIPEVVSIYYARDSLLKLWRMFYQYGLFKPLVAWKIGKIFSFRQFVPAIFLLVLAISAILSIWWPVASAFFLGTIILYGLATISFSMSAVRKRGWRCGLNLIATFPVIHFAYGIGYLKGLLDFIVIRRKRDLSEMPMTR